MNIGICIFSILVAIFIQIGFIGKTLEEIKKEIIIYRRNTI